MCGIIQIRKKTNLIKTLIKRYEKQKTRGKEGFGFVLIKNKKVISYKRAEREETILKKLDIVDGDEILFHHRFPTSTENVYEASHPIKVQLPNSKYVFYVVHNGVISNDDELKKKHELLGIKYSTEMKKRTVIETEKTIYTMSEEVKFNDSEALAYELALLIEGKQTEIKAKGSIAFICIQADLEGNALKMYYGRNLGSPLMIENSRELFGLSSETGTNIETNTLFCYDYQTEETTEQELEIPTRPYENLGSYNKDWNKSYNSTYGTYKEYNPDGTEKKFGYNTDTDEDWYEKEREKHGKTNPPALTKEEEEQFREYGYFGEAEPDGVDLIMYKEDKDYFKYMEAWDEEDLIACGTDMQIEMEYSLEKGDIEKVDYYEKAMKACQNYLDKKKKD